MTTNAHWDKPQFNNFVALPRIAIEELDLAAFKLYAHYIDETRWYRPYKKGRRATSSDCGIGKAAIAASRKTLEEKGYIVVIPASKPDEADEIVLQTSIWERNRERYENEVAQVDYALGVLAGSTLTDEQIEAIEQMLVVRKQATGGPQTGQAGPQTGHWWPTNGPDSNIDDSLKDHLSTPPDEATDESAGEPPSAAGGGEPPSMPRQTPYEQNNVTSNTGSQAPGKKVAQKVVTADVPSHPMAIYLAGRFNVKILPPEVIKTLTSSIKYQDDQGQTVVAHCPLVQWEKTLGYEAFVRSRVEELQGMKLRVPMTFDNVVRNLAKLYFQPEPGSNKMPGFYQWLKAHPEHVTPVQATPGTERIDTGDMPIDDRPWATGG